MTQAPNTTADAQLAQIMERASERVNTVMASHDRRYLLAEVKRLEGELSRLRAAGAPNWQETKGCIRPTHEAADAFWKYWRENGETHKHCYYESTWSAINAALNSTGQIEPAINGSASGAANEATEADARDAARYRWLRYRTTSMEMPDPMLSGVKLDRYIDSALTTRGDGGEKCATCDESGVMTRDSDDGPIRMTCVDCRCVCSDPYQGPLYCKQHGSARRVTLAIQEKP